MTDLNLPQTSDDILGLPEREVPDAVHGLIGSRRMSVLMRGLHRDLESPDTALRDRARAALQKLGFPDT